MELKILKHIPPWDWPKEAGKILLGILRDDHADGSERLLAAELAAIHAVANIRPEEAAELLDDLTDSGDEDIVEAVFEALAMAQWQSEDEEWEEDLEDELLH